MDITSLEKVIYTLASIPESSTINFTKAGLLTCSKFIAFPFSQWHNDKPQ